MKPVSIRAKSLDIPFKLAFTHASASREATQSLWVEARDAGGATGHGEGCPREYVTAETLDGSLDFVAGHEREWLQSIDDVTSLRRWVADNRRSIDRHPSAWAAVELALLDLMGKQTGESVETLLGLPELSGRFRYTAVIGDSPLPRFQAELARYLQAGFRDLKIKLSGDATRDRQKTKTLRKAGIEPASVRADANNLWQDADRAVSDLAELDFAFAAVEEPLRAGDYTGMATIAAAHHCAIILDESLLRIEQLPALAAYQAPWIVNLRISKMGGLSRSLALADAIRGAGLKMIIGAHVGETSLLTRAALTVANAFRDILVAQEGAFGTHLLERDVVDPPIMFGAGGILDAASIPKRGGLGLETGGL